MDAPVAGRRHGAWRLLLQGFVLFFALVMQAEPEAGEPTEARAFDLPAGPADRVLKEFSLQSGIDVVFAPRTVAGVKTRGVRGTMTPREALKALLGRAPLVIARDSETGAYMITPAASAASPPRRTASMAEALTPREPGVPRRGVVQGRVVNAASHEYLSQAVVRVAGSAEAVITDRDGAFNLTLPAGPHLLVVSHAGLKPARVPVVVEAGGVTREEIELTSDFYTLETFTVVGDRDGQAKALQNQRQSINSKTAVAIDAFGNPGTGVGELLQRVPGVAVDFGSSGEPGAIYIRGMGQNFSSLMLDGNAVAVTDGQTLSQTYIYFGQINTSNLDTLEIIKAPLPEMDGNAISGYINLRTKRAFDRTPGRNVTLSVATKWSDLDQHPSVPGRDRPKVDAVALDYSEVFGVFGGTDNLGVSLSASTSASENYVHEAGPNLATLNLASTLFVAPPEPGADYEPLVRGWSSGTWNANARNSYNETFGLNIDYRTRNDAVFYLRSTYSNTEVDAGAFPSFFRWSVAAPAAASSFVPGSTYDVVSVNPVATVNLDTAWYVRETESFTIGGGLEQKLWNGSGTLTLEAYHSANMTAYPRFNEIRAQLTGVGFQIDRRGADPMLPHVMQTAGPDWTDPRNYSIVPAVHAGTAIAGSRSMTFNVPAAATHFRADLEKYVSSRIPMAVKLGAKYNVRRAKSDRYYRYHTWNGLTDGILPYVGYNMKLGEGNYGPFPFLQIPGSGLPNDPWRDPSAWIVTPGNAFATTYDHLNSRQEAREEILAGYIQAQARWKRLRLLAGLRVETTHPSGKSPLKRAQHPDSGNTPDPTRSIEENIARAEANFIGWEEQSARYTDLFPGFHAVYDLGERWQLRASYTRSITRPPLNNYSPSYTVNDLTREVRNRGNVGLDPYASDNFDAGVAYYFEPLGMLAANVFIKRIDNFLASRLSVIGSGENNGFGGRYAGYTLVQNENVRGATVAGLELSYAQEFSFLPAPLSGLGAFANATLLDTEARIDEVASINQLQNFTPRTANAGLHYRGRGFDLRLLLNYRGRTYRSSATALLTSAAGGGGIPGPWVYELYQDDRLMLDLKFQYALTRRCFVFCDVYNLTKEWALKNVYEAFGRTNVYQAQAHGRVYVAGVKLRY